MQTVEILPDEGIVRKSIAERSRELRLLRSVERALARYRRENEAAGAIRTATDATTSLRGEGAINE